MDADNHTIRIDDSHGNTDAPPRSSDDRTVVMERDAVVKTSGSGSGSGNGVGERRWQEVVAEASKPPPAAPWYETLLQNRIAVSIGAGIIALVMLALFKPPIVQKTPDNALEDAQLSVKYLLVWSIIIAVMTYIAPFAWKAMESAIASTVSAS